MNDGLPQRILSGGIERRLGKKSMGSPRDGVNGGCFAEEEKAERQHPPSLARASFRSGAYSFGILHRVLELGRAPVKWDMHCG